jgi:hypothetical protein
VSDGAGQPPGLLPVAEEQQPVDEEMGESTHLPAERTVATFSRQDGGLSKLECFVWFNDVSYWHSRTRHLIANAEIVLIPPEFFEKPHFGV